MVGYCVRIKEQYGNRDEEKEERGERRGNELKRDGGEKRWVLLSREGGKKGRKG